MVIASGLQSVRLLPTRKMPGPTVVPQGVNPNEVSLQHARTGRIVPVATGCGERQLWSRQECGIGTRASENRWSADFGRGECQRIAGMV